MIDARELKKNIPVQQFYQETLGDPSARTAASSIFFCPFHDDKKTPNFTVFHDGGFKCFSCSVSGDIIAFHMKRNTLEFTAAVQALAQKYAPHLLNGNGGKAKPKAGIVTVEYDYKDASGKRIFQVVRFNPKGFRQRRPDNEGGWIWNLQGVELVPYRLPEIITSTGTVYICEGEKDCALLAGLGLITTSCAGGAGKWKTVFNQHLKARDVVVLMDNDKSGRAHGQKIAESLYGIAKSLKLVSFDELPEHGDVSDYLQTHSLDDLARKIEHTFAYSTPVQISEASEGTEPSGDTGTQEDEKNETWEEPLFFGEIETPEIPTNLLPTWLGDFVEALRLHTQTPSGMGVMLGLGVVAACLQKRFEVEPFEGYREPLSLWTVTGLPPATRKTAVVNALTAPLCAWEKEQAASMEREIIDSSIRRAVNLEAISRLQKDAAKTKDSLERARLIEEIKQLKLETPEEMHAPQLWTSDSTPERLQSLLVQQNERMACIADEGGVFEVMSGLYSDGRANLDVFLQAHAGSPVRVDRGTRTAHLSKPAFSFGLAIQPAILKALGEGNKRVFRGNGCLARFLFCLPRSNIGRRDVRARNLIPETTRLAYEREIKSLLNIAPVIDANDVEVPRILRLDKEALDEFSKFAQYIEVNQGEGCAFESFSDWSGKLPGAALRIAGLCHVCEYHEDNLTINKSTMGRALDLCDLLIGHARAAFDIIGEDQAVDDAKTILPWVIACRERYFKRSDCYRDFHGRFKKMDRLAKALGILTERNIISDKVALPTKKPTIIHWVNPAIRKGGTYGLA